MKMRITFLILILFLVAPANASDDRTQEVHFDGSSVDGQARLPNGSSIVEARLKEILPLFELEKDFQDKVYESIDHMR
jgi:hypothetical protein